MDIKVDNHCVVGFSLTAVSRRGKVQCLSTQLVSSSNTPAHSLQPQSQSESLYYRVATATTHDATGNGKVSFSLRCALYVCWKKRSGPKETPPQGKHRSLKNRTHLLVSWGIPHVLCQPSFIWFAGHIIYTQNPRLDILFSSSSKQF